jgi:L,D-peptidoglycan transpeptidase YkuD (ErfK/YbiS/YcfS/YnhG family)
MPRHLTRIRAVAGTVMAAIGLVMCAGAAWAAVTPSLPPPSPPPSLPMGLTDVYGATQVIVVTAASGRASVATLRAFQDTGGTWAQVVGPVRARVGRKGWSIPGHRREGSGTTPEGIFAIGATMYGIRPNPGVAYRYHRLVPGDYWDENPAMGSRYNTFRHSDTTDCARNPFGGRTECLWRGAPAYDYLAVIGFNSPVTGPWGSGIFLHVGTAAPTSGCVSVSRANLLRILRWLRPSSAPRIILAGPTPLSRY